MSDKSLDEVLAELEQTRAELERTKQNLAEQRKAEGKYRAGKDELTALRSLIQPEINSLKERVGSDAWDLLMVNRPLADQLKIGRLLVDRLAPSEGAPAAPAAPAAPVDPLLALLTQSAAKPAVTPQAPSQAPAPAPQAPQAPAVAQAAPAAPALSDRTQDLIDKMRAQKASGTEYFSLVERIGRQ